MTQRVFDAHFHVIDDAFPLVPNDGYFTDYMSQLTGCSSWPFTTIIQLGISLNPPIWYDTGIFRPHSRPLTMCVPLRTGYRPRFISLAVL